MHISLTGKPCSGKSTVAKILAEKYGFQIIGWGDVFKAEAKRRGMNAEEFNAFCLKDPSFDYYMDKETERLAKALKGQKIIFDSRLAWHFAPKSFKVFVDISEDEMGKRLAGSDRSGKEKIDDAEEAKLHLINRFNLENQRYMKLYGVDNLNPKNYDLVLDSTSKTPEELADELYEACLKYYKKK